jgi:hypothetical protein
VEARIFYDKEDKRGVRRSKTYTAKNGAQYYVLMHKEERWAKIVNAKRRNVVDIVRCSNYNRLRTAARRALFHLGVIFEVEFKPSKSKDGKELNEKSQRAYWAKKNMEGQQ